MDILGKDPKVGDFIIVTYTKVIGRITKITNTQITIAGTNSYREDMRYFNINQYSDYLIIKDLEEYKEDKLIRIDNFIYENPNQFISMKDLIIGAEYINKSDKFVYIGKGSYIIRKNNTNNYTWGTINYSNKHLFYKVSNSWRNKLYTGRMNRISINDDNNTQRAHTSIDNIINDLSSMDDNYNYKFKLNSFDIDINRGTVL